MPVIRRYLRVSRYTVLECRIFTASPTTRAQLQRPGVIESIFAALSPLIPKKLAETHGTRKQKPVRDEIEIDGFTVAVTITKTGIVHSLLVKEKKFTERGEALKGNSTKLMDEMRDMSTTDDAGGGGSAQGGNGKERVVVRVESDDEEPAGITVDAPPLGGDGENSVSREQRQQEEDDPLFRPNPHQEDSENGDSDDDDEEDEDIYEARGTSLPRRQRRARGGGQRRRQAHNAAPEQQQSLEHVDDKKNLEFSMSYDGYTTYSWVLNLVVHRHETGDKQEANKNKGKERAKPGSITKKEDDEENKSGVDLMDNWLQMSQVVRNDGDDV